MKTAFLAYLCLLIAPSLGSRILLVSPLIPSHLFTMTHIGKELVARKHDVWMLLPHSANPPSWISTSGINFIRFNMDDSKDPFTPKFDKTGVRNYVKSSTFSRVALYLKQSSHLCHSLLEDEVTFRKLQDIRFDFVLVDDLAFSLCLYTLPYKLGVPYGSVTSIVWPYVSAVSLLPSISPARQHQLTNEMTFTQRWANTIHKLFGDLLVYYYIDSKEFNIYTKDKPYTSLTDLASQTSMWFIDQDVLLDYTMPMMPNMVHVGGLSTGPAKRLPDRLEQIADNAHDGLIVFTFGSTISGIADDKVDTFLAAFRQINQTVVWKHQPILGKSTPSNVIVADWLPQNDLLGHRNTKIFITHCGNSGQHEALYHGVPMIGFPLTAEQPFNAKRIEHKNFGIAMDINKFTATELVQNIKTLLNPNGHASHIKRASRIFRAQGNPRERLANWVERLIDYGGDHLKSPATSLRLHQLLVYDVVVVCVVCGAALFVLLKFVIRLLSWFSQSRKMKHD